MQSVQIPSFMHYLFCSFNHRDVLQRFFKVYHISEKDIALNSFHKNCRHYRKGRLSFGLKLTIKCVQSMDIL